MLPPCTAFAESVATRVAVRRGARAVEETAGRQGIAVLTTRATTDGLRFEAWYDALVVWRETPAGRLLPDTDGLVGGRWAGGLSGAGDATLSTRPFMPPGVLDAADLSDTFADFLPPLPAGPVAPGSHWQADDGRLVVERLADSVSAGRALGRYRWRRLRAAPGDSLTFGQRTDDLGWLVWDPSSGPLAWRREVTVQATMRGGPRVSDGVETLVVQAVNVRRVTDRVVCP